METEVLENTVYDDIKMRQVLQSKFNKTCARCLHWKPQNITERKF